MKKNGLILLLILVFQTGGYAQTAHEISDKAAAMIEKNSMEMTSTLKIMDDKGRERTRKMEITTREFSGVVKTLVKFKEPAEIRGTTMLIYDYSGKPADMWIYMPALRKVRRIVSDEKAKSFMGSEFSNSDLSVPETENFDYKILSAEQIEGSDCWKIEASCKNENVSQENGYSKRRMWIDKGSFLTRKMEFYDLKGELHKVQQFTNYRKLPNGKYFAWSMEKDNVQNGRKSFMIVEKFGESTSVPESMFSTAMMSN
jgi:outer membrane lipoprotein-sorting protein